MEVRSRVRRSRWPRRGGQALIGVLAVAVVALVGVAPTAAASKGAANMLYWPSGPFRIVYGQDLHIEGYVEDQSRSCFGIPRDCDNPGGYVAMLEMPDDIAVAVGDLSPSPGTDNYSTFSMTMRGKQLAPGHYVVDMAYAGDFDPFFFESTLDVVKNPCTMTVVQSGPSSRPGDPVTFTAALTGSTFLHPGATITFTDGLGNFLASDTVDGNDRISFSTAALPQGDTTIVASYGGTAIDDACSGAVAHHVDTDPPPVAVDDSYSTEVGVPITVHPMANDYDPGGGPIRADYQSAPDAGDVEAIDNATLVFTPPDGYIGETSMHYVVYDSIGQSSSEATIRFSWGCTPEANADAFDVAYGEALVVGAPGVTSNDATCDLPTEVIDQPDHGTLVYDTQNGGFTYTPAPGFVGPDSFVYQYAQGLESPVSARVDLFVHVPPPPPPTSTTTTTEATSTSTTTEPTSTTTTTEATSSTTTTEPTSSTTTTEPISTSTTTTTEPTSTTTTTEPLGPPTVTSISPDHAAPGTEITVTGTNFVPGATTVTVGGVTVPAADVDVDVDAGSGFGAPAAALAAEDTLRFTLPEAVGAGLSDLTVTTEFGAAVHAAAFTVDLEPTTTTTTTTQSTAAGPSTTAASVAVVPDGNGTAPPSGTTAASAATLPATGDDPTRFVFLGFVLLAGGTVVLLLRRPQRD